MTRKPMSPAILNEFADLLHERRERIAPPFTQNSKPSFDLWSILHERELRGIDGALARIRAGSYGTCAGCGGTIQFLHLYQEPTADRCLTCVPQRQRRAL